MKDPGSREAARAAERLVWVDAARGLSVLGVVVFHVGLWHFLAHSYAVWPPADRGWTRINDILGSVRIPLLLGVSGLVLSRRVTNGWTDRSNVVRSISNYYLYVVWLLVYAVFFAVVSVDGLPHRIGGLSDLASQMLIPDTTLWYVFALALYVPVLAALRPVPPVIVVAGLAILTVVIRANDSGGVQAYKIGEVAFFFAVGVHGAELIRRLADEASMLTASCLVMLSAVVTLGGRIMTGEISGSVLFMVRGLVFMAASVAVIALVVRWRPAGRALSAIGRQTLPIYVLHPLMIYGLIAVTAQWSGFDGFVARPWVSLSYPVVVTTGIAVASLLLHRLALAAGMSWLFGLPGGARTRLQQRLGTSPGHRA